jgi:hypothetical protein
MEKQQLVELLMRDTIPSADDDYAIRSAAENGLAKVVEVLMGDARSIHPRRMTTRSVRLLKTDMLQ